MPLATWSEQPTWPGLAYLKRAVPRSVCDRMSLKSQDLSKPCTGWSSAPISQGCYAVVFVPAAYAKKAWHHRSNKISCESLRKRSATPSATPSQLSSMSACDSIRQILCSKSETTVLGSLTAGQAKEDSDLPICGHEQKILAPNWISAVRLGAALVSSFVYRSIHEPRKAFGAGRWGGFTPLPTSSGKQLSDTGRSA